jgi:hypothetical protein
MEIGELHHVNYSWLLRSKRQPPCKIGYRKSSGEALVTESAIRCPSRCLYTSTLFYRFRRLGMFKRLGGCINPMQRDI